MMTMDTLKLIGRTSPLFENDISSNKKKLEELVSSSRFLVIGGAGSIGQAVTREIFKRNPQALHVVDISENNMVELVRDIRSTLGYIDGDFRTFAIDCGSVEYRALINSTKEHDYVLNLSALKHVRSEKDPFTLMRLIEVNILNTIRTVQMAREKDAKKYFCVSTDKAANPVNMMGASKRIMEMFLMRESETMEISTARFANVAFSDGSLLHGFNQRLIKEQPIVAPNDVKRYFITPKESGQLCLLSCLFGNNRDIFFPKLNEELHLLTFKEIAEAFLLAKGFQPHICSSEEEARALASSLPKKDSWPCFFSPSDTTGEKDFEEFFSTNETLDLKTFTNIGIIKNDPLFDKSKLDDFKIKVNAMRSKNNWNKDELLNFFQDLLPNFKHIDTGKYLDAKM